MHLRNAKLGLLTMTLILLRIHRKLILFFSPSLRIPLYHYSVLSPSKSMSPTLKHESDALAIIPLRRNLLEEETSL